MGALVGFEAAGRLESITLAARELNLTHGAVSRSVQQLEQFFGFPLFERRNRRIFLTRKGRLLSGRLTDLLQQLGAVVDTVRQEGEDEVLVLSCEPTLSMRWLMPRLAEIDRDVRDTTVQLRTAGGGIDLAKQGVDLAIRRSDFQWPEHYHATPLVREMVGPVCHPDYWARVKGDMGQVTLLHTKTRPDAWRDWSRNAQPLQHNGRERVFDHFYFSLQAAVAGLGIAIGPSLMVQEDIDAGHLIAPFGFDYSGCDYVALSLRPLDGRGKLAELVEWLKTHIPGEAEAC